MKVHSLHNVLLCGALLCVSGQVFSQTDLTNNGGIITAQYAATDDGENYPKVIDNYAASKYYIGGHTTFWIGYQSAYTAIVTQYTITSANDVSDRDPKSWTLQGSNNGSSWTTLNTQTNQTFTGRLQTRTFTFTNTTSYLYYRLNITAVYSGTDAQLAEWELWATGVTTPPSNTTATALSGQRVTVGWTDNSTAETGYRIERSSDGKSYTAIATTTANIQTYTDSNLCAGARYSYRIRAVNAAGASNASVAAIVKTTGVTLLTDITDYTNGVVADQYSTTGSEGITKSIDNNIYSKYYTTNAATWLRYYLSGGAVVTQYAITAANDAADRDPKSWTLQGSANGSSWTTLNTQSNEIFTNRFEKRVYAFPNTTTYTYYRLNVSGNAGGAATQLAEWQLYGTGTGTANSTAPAAPAGLTAQGVSGNQIILNWTDNTTTETQYRIERSTDSATWSFYRILNPGSTRFYSRDLTALTTYYYRLRAENSFGNSAYVAAKATTTTSASPATWVETWDHTKTLTKVYDDTSISVYYDQYVSNTVTWMQSDFTKVWSYVRKNYGSFCDKKLYMVFHGDGSGISGGHATSVFNEDHSYRNVVDLGGVWDTRNVWNYGATTHEIAHVVEGSSKGVDHSPAWSIWHDSKWAEIFNYDVYKRMGWTTEAAALFTEMQTVTDDYPRAGTQWFKNWFYPIYTRADSGAALNRYFTLLAQYFPQHNGGYTRDLNMGEFIHFWSGAAQVNLKGLADTAFGWTENFEMQFVQAQIDFPFTYPNPSSRLMTQVVTPKETGQQKPALALWPNPAHNVLYFTNPGKAPVYTVELYSLAGVKVKSVKVTGSGMPIQVSHLPAGVYVITISDGKEIIDRKKMLIN